MTIHAVSRHVGILAVALLLATGVGLKAVHAQNSKPASATEAADKKKAAEKKKDTTKRDTTQNTGGSAPMSGFRPDPISNY